MQTYTIETAINEQGMIVLPVELKNLSKHKVKLVVTDLEPNLRAVDIFTQLTQRIATLNESDLDLEQIYQDRTQNERENLFT